MIDKPKEIGYNDNRYKLTEEQVRQIQVVLSKGERVELIPIKDGVRVFEIRRKEIK